METSVANFAHNQPNRWFWQFRLRELLSAMIAIGALLTVVVQNWGTTTPSPIYLAVRPEQVIPRIASQHGLTNVSRGGGVGEATDTFGTASCVQDDAIPDSHRDQIKRDLGAYIKKTIAEHRGQELGAGSAGDILLFRYTCGRRAGIVYVAFFSVSSEIWRINSVSVETGR